jgi:hypothetical protein
MKVKYFSHIDGYDVFIRISEPTVDPEETKRAIQKKYPGLELAALNSGDIQNLFLDNAVYSQPGPGAEFIEDSVAMEFESRTGNLGEKKLLSADGAVIIPDYRGIEYWQKQGDFWQKNKIEQLGVSLPEGAVLNKDLTSDQLKEIAAQAEEAQIAALTTEEKAAEKQKALDNLADEVARMEKRAQIQNKPFDAVAWYEEHKMPIETKYAS